MGTVYKDIVTEVFWRSSELTFNNELLVDEIFNALQGLMEGGCKGGCKHEESSCSLTCGSGIVLNGA